MSNVRGAVADKEAASTPAKVTPKQALTQIVESNMGAIGASLPTGMSQERFARLLLTAANTNPGLLECSPRSFLAAGVTAAQLGLEPNDPRGLAYLIPFNDKKRGRIVNFIVGYRGMIELARRSGMVTSIFAYAVYEGDVFSYKLGLDPDLQHIPNPDGDEDPKKITHAYAVAKIGGDSQFVVLTRKQVEKARSSSRGSDSSYSPWQTHYAEMAIKTAIRRLCKMLPQSVEMAKADTLDERPLNIGDLGQVVADDEALEVNELDEAKAAAIEATASDPDESAAEPENMPANNKAEPIDTTATDDAGTLPLDKDAK